MKTYTYKNVRYLMAVKLPAFLMLVSFLYSMLILSEKPKSALYFIVAVCSLLVFLNFVITLSFPEVIKDDDNEIQFCSFGRKHTYYWNDVKKMKVKEINFAKKIYLRIGDNTLLRGKYWIDIEMFNDGKELYDKFKFYENKLRSNTNTIDMNNKNRRIKEKNNC